MKHLMKQVISAFAIALCAVAGSAYAATGVSFANLSGAEYDTAGVFVKGDALYTATIDDGGGFDRLSSRSSTTDWSSSRRPSNLPSVCRDRFTSRCSTRAQWPAVPRVWAWCSTTSRTARPTTWSIRFFRPATPIPANVELTADRVSPIPEPSEYALMLMGLGVVGWAARRRTQSAA